MAAALRGFKTGLEKATLKNNYFRRVLYTGKHSQLVLMSLKPREEIGAEVHGSIDQFFRFERGQGKVVVNGKSYTVGDGDCAIVPAGARHNVINTSKKSALKLYTIYSPPEHQDRTVRRTRAQAVAFEEHFDGKTTE